MLQAYSDSELLRTLANIDISVPTRSESRTKEYKERYSTAYLLSTLAEKGVLSYPLSLVKRERPDFLLTLGTERIGIEHTEAVLQNEAHKMGLREKGYGPNIYFYSRHQPGELRKSKKELIEEIEANHAGDGWTDNSVEIDWAGVMFHSIEQKVIKLLKVGFERFDQDWLLIYDNWSLPRVDRKKASTFLNEYAAKSNALYEFARIYIITGQYLCEVDAPIVKLFGINDWWN